MSALRKSSDFLLRNSDLLCSKLSKEIISIKGIATTPLPINEPILDYSLEANSAHLKELTKCINDYQTTLQDVPIVIKGKEYRTNRIQLQRIPFDHRKSLAQFYYANDNLIHLGIEAAVESRREWLSLPVEEKLKIFERAANLVSGTYRQQLNAATILGQAKTIKQAEIDSAAELADFLRFNCYYLRQLLEFGQPISPNEYEKNSTKLLPLEGFITAISPFNFTAIGGNLATAPAIMGNCVVWKPSDSAILSNYIIFKLLKEAGLPEGVINFIPSEGLEFGRITCGNINLAGINFTGSVATFQWLSSEIGLNIQRYRTFPRVVGECGGKNFHLIHKSADLQTVIAQTIRSAFEYSGQKCSACSRLYVPAGIWYGGMKEKLVNIAKSELKIGPATDHTSYTSAVIDAKAFERIRSYLNYAKATPSELKVLCGGEANDEVGYFVDPTIIETNNPSNRLMHEEIFGPVLTVYPYSDTLETDKVLEMVDANPFALTGAVFAQDESFIKRAEDKLNVGNFYINDKSTGAVVGHQPFGGWRHSGTNDKAGGPHYLMRWCNQQTVKRTTKNLPSY